jgi:hypothetical protein
MYTNLNKENGENGEEERDPLTQQLIGYAISPGSAHKMNIQLGF